MRWKKILRRVWKHNKGRNLVGIDKTPPFGFITVEMFSEADIVLAYNQNTF